MSIGFNIRQWICSFESAAKAKEIAGKMRREYPWSQYAEDVRVCASNYSFLMSRIQMVKTEAEAPDIDTEAMKGHTKREFEGYWHRELGQALLEELVDQKLCRIYRIADGNTIRYSVELPVVMLKGEETLFKEEPNENQT